MAKIEYVITHKNAYCAFGTVQYTNGVNRNYDLVTSKFPNTVMTFCVTAKHCDIEENTDGTTVKTYYN